MALHRASPVDDDDGAASSATLMRDALTLAQNAVHYDAQGQTSLALVHYQQCVGLFLQASQCGDCTPPTRALILAKTGEYLQRAEFLKRQFQQLQQQQQRPQVAPGPSPSPAPAPAPVAQRFPSVSPASELTRSSPDIAVEPIFGPSVVALPEAAAPAVALSPATAPSPEPLSLRNSAPALPAPADADWLPVYRKLVLLDDAESTRLLDAGALRTWEAKLHGVPPRRGRVFLTAARFAFVPHREPEQRSSPPDVTYFQVSDVISVPWRQVTALAPEGDVYMLRSSRLRVTTRGGSLLLRGMALSRDRVLAQMHALWQASIDATRVFGVPFSELLARDRAAGATDQQVPLVLERMVGELEERGLRTDSLFQSQPQLATAITEAAASIDAGVDVGWDSLDVYVVAALLKRWLSAAPEPLLGSDLSDAVQSVGSMADPLARTKSVRSLLLLLPDLHRRMLKLLVYFLATVAASADENRMTVKRLGAVFASCVVRSDNTEVMTATAALVTTLIQDRRAVF